MGGGGGDRGPQTDKHLPPSTFTGKFLRNCLIKNVEDTQVTDDLWKIKKGLMQQGWTMNIQKKDLQKSAKTQ
jgi:hypothetical protein